MLDTRLKNNKSALRTSIVIVALVTICFALVVSNFGNRVDDYFEDFGSDLESESFIGILFQSNYVLYPEVLEKSGKSVREEDLYLAFEEAETPEVSVDEYYGNEFRYEGSGEQLKAQEIAELKNNLLRNNSLYVTELGVKMDYCVIDENTQTILKNTARKIEQLIDGENQEYVYYLIIRYDQNGSIYDISVSGNNAEQFLKNAQATANSVSFLPLEEKQKTVDYVLINDGWIEGKITVTQRNPQNATFIYAMTEEQDAAFSWFPVYSYDSTRPDSAWVAGFIRNDDRREMYYRLGVGRLYLCFLAGITGIVFFLTRYRPQRMADTMGTKHSMELILCIQWFLAVALYWMVINLVYGVNENFSSMIGIRFWPLFGVMFLLFAAWYWCLLSIRDIFRNPLSFLRERSLIYRCGKRIKGRLQAIRSRWKAELAGIDLGKDTTKLLKRLIVVQFVVLSLICCFWFLGIFIMVIYSVLLYWGLKHYICKIQKQYANLMQATNAIAQGKFDNSFEGDFGVFESYKSELYQIQGGFRTAVEEEVKSQRMKTELITNVSHDLKTPLTAIITYIDLLKEENVTEEQKKSYLETLERKSLRLKILIEDLFEISKASSGNVKLEPVAVDICNLIRQVYLEHEDKMAAGGLDIRFDLPEEKVILQLDSQKTYRIFENLYVNITKYAMPNTRVYIQAQVVHNGDGQDKAPAGRIHIELKNISAQELTVNPMDLTERFVRGDVSRNTEGSGLGLAIAKSFTELQGGRFGIEIDGDLFKAVLEWEIIE